MLFIFVIVCILQFQMYKYLKQGKYKYNQNNLLGQGSFGKVYKGLNTQSSQQVALKQIQLSKLQKNEQEMKVILLSEISVMRKFNKKMMLDPCPFLVRQQDVFRTDKHIYIVMQICQGGTLEEQLRGKRLKQKQCIKVLYCMARGLEYMHEMGIAHRDLKPQNIFISNIRVGQGVGKQLKIYKIGDFGFASQKQQFDIAMGTLPYMAPQMFKKQKYDNLVDIWSMGVIAYEIMYGGLYFIGKDKWQIQKSVTQKPFALTERQKQQASANYQDLLFRCLSKQVKYRIAANQLLSHPLFAEIQQQLSQLQAAFYEDPSSIMIKSQPSFPVNKLSSSQSNKQQQKVFQQKSEPQTPNIQIKSQYIGHQQSQKQTKVQNSIIVFKKIHQLLKQCARMRQMAEQFHNFQQVTHRFTQFIQIYLLKDAYTIMNRLTYTVMHKQNHIQLSQQQFNYLTNPQNNKQYQQIYDICIKECTWITGLFNEKYKYFINYISKFDQQDQLLIKGIVDEDAYKEINTQIFQKQLRKWVYVFQEDKQREKYSKYNNWHKLYMDCKSMLELRVKN